LATWLATRLVAGYRGTLWVEGFFVLR